MRSNAATTPVLLQPSPPVSALMIPFARRSPRVASEAQAAPLGPLAELESIAVFRALQLGDLLCAVPALRALRYACPTTHITLIGLPWARDFVQRLPYVDAFLEFPGFPGLPERPPAIEALPAFFATAQANKFDLAIQLHGSGALSNPLVSALGARHTAGFVTADGWRPDADAGRYLTWSEDLPEVRRLLALTSFLGSPPRGEALELPVSVADHRAFLRLREGFEPNLRGYICVHAGARRASRRWPSQRFAKVADRLAAEGYQIVLTGSAEEASLVAELRAAMREPAVDLAGRTTLGSLAALTAEAELVVCNDTGMSHVAAAMKTPSVVISCRSDVERWRPLDRSRHRVLSQMLSCRPDAHTRYPTGDECAVAVEAEAVIAEALDVLTPPAGELDGEIDGKPHGQ